VRNKPSFIGLFIAMVPKKVDSKVFEQKKASKRSKACLEALNI